MKRRVVSHDMGSWSASSPAPHLYESAAERYRQAQEALKRIRAWIQMLLKRARDAGFELEMALRIPELRQARAAEVTAIRELAKARTLLAS